MQRFLVGRKKGSNLFGVREFWPFVNIFGREHARANRSEFSLFMRLGHHSGQLISRGEQPSFELVQREEGQEIGRQAKVGLPRKSGPQFRRL